jgi:anti-anti-sigma factor
VAVENIPKDDPSYDGAVVLPLQRHNGSQRVSLRAYRSGPASVIEVAGEIDIAVTPAMRDLVCSVSTSEVVFDLRRVTFIDASGLGVLANAWRRAAPVGGSVRLVSPPERVRKLLRLTQLDKVLATYESLPEATR